MTDSILLTIRKMIGGAAEYDENDPFNFDLIIHINTFLGVLNQLGVGVEGFKITGTNETWSDFLTGTDVSLDEVKTYLYKRCRLVFDPPQSGIVMQAIKDSINELTWRIATKVETHVRE